MTVKLAVVMDAIDNISRQKDSTVAMLLAAQQRQWDIHYVTVENLSAQQGNAYAMAQKLTVTDADHPWYHLEPACQLNLGHCDAILMRKDPPFNIDYIYATYILELAEKCGTLVVNKPQSLRDANEKFFTTWFTQCCPETIVSCHKQQLKQFIIKYQDVIVKPLDGMGGANIFRLKEQDPNLNVVIDNLTQQGHRHIMAQQFIPEIIHGDKRILLIDGQPIPYALARIPAPGETRANLAVGGKGVSQPLSDRDKWICEQIGPTLRKKGLIFVGIDVIGDYLTEINVTSPTCIRELDAANHLNIASTLLDCIEKRMGSR